MNNPLIGPRLKLDRAKHHLVQLKEAERNFFEANTPRIIFDPEMESGNKLAKLVMDSPPPEEFHVIAGEMIYQLRSTLDQIAVAFARLSVGPTRPKDVHFPSGDSFKGFVASCKNWDRRRDRPMGNLRYFDSDFRKEILRTRPYNGGNEVLRAVFLMANIDKHMELIAIGTSGGMNGINSFIVEGVSFILRGPGNLNEGVVFAEFAPGGRLIPKHANAKISVAGQITLGDVGGPYAGHPLIPALSAMLTEVIRVYNGCLEALRKRARAEATSRVPPQVVTWNSRLFQNWRVRKV